MAVSELVKATLFGYPRNANFACLDFLGALGGFLVVPHAPRPGCVCHGQAEVWDAACAGHAAAKHASNSDTESTTHCG